MTVGVDRAEFERLGGRPGCDYIELVVEGEGSEAELADKASKLVGEIYPGLHVLSVSEYQTDGSNDE